MVDKLTAEQIKEYKSTFRLYDDDEDGIVTSAEVGTIMRNHGICISEGELTALIKTHRACGKDTAHVDFPEFLAMMVTCQEHRPSEDDELESLVEAFKVFDPTENGRITSRELRTIVMTLGESMDATLVDSMIREADIDGDGLIDYQRFVSILVQSEAGQKIQDVPVTCDT